VIFDMFNELQRPRPWAPGHEQQVFRDGIAQAELADAMGYDCWWMVEHHCTPEFSYSSTPEMMNAVLTQRTERIRLGHSGVLSPFKINHPLRVAERAAVLDVLSGGRAEIALARSGGAEWDTFAINPDTTNDELDEAYQICVKAWTEDEFSWDSPYVTIPPRNVVPKPLQDPHPRLWQTVSTPASFGMAGERGVGALATTLLSTVDTIKMLLDEYDAGLARSPGSVGKFTNSEKGVFTFVHCAETTDEAIASRASEAALWYVNAAPKVFSVPRTVWTEMIRGEPTTSTDPGRAQSVSNVDDVMVDMDPDDPHPIVRIMNRQALGYELDPVEVYEALEPLDSVIVGDVETCRRKIRKYADAGVDRLMCLMQYGVLSHEHAMSSMRLVGEAFIPEFAPATVD
jgi:alkanesulfonate monooxygenase SsuD/methylene tetrahydromethanopterin reductase-like flavin-dependent oxidoreductase (luciferase family)